MIVQNIGYLNLEAVLNLSHFSIYETHKKTQILITDTSEDDVHLYYPKQDRLPYKDVEGKKICRCKKVFDSKNEPLTNIDTTKWNGGNQIMSYKEFSCW